MQDSIVKAAKAAGKGVIAGALQGEGKDVVKGLLKSAANAAGERRFLSTAPVPLEGATILIFDAQRPTTAAETTLTTDKKGSYAAVLKPGKYYGFAVHLDLATFRLVTAGIPFINCRKDSLTAMDTAIAVEDVTNPSVTGVYDATSADENGLFLVGGIPAGNARVSIMFSEPMQRESVRGLVVGKVDLANVNGGMALKDSLAATGIIPTWSGDSKQLTLSLGRLESGSKYGIIIPISMKDLAKNPLRREYRAQFDAVSDDQSAAQAFAVSSTFPAEKDSLKPTQNPTITFTHPPQIFSAINSIAMDPKIEGYWEVTGSRITFIHKTPFTIGTNYTIALPDTLLDLGGNRLDKSSRFSFKAKDYDGAAKDKKGRDQAVALMMEDFFSAYLQGDVGRMAGFLDPSFRLEADAQFLSSQQFLDRVSKDVSSKSLLSAGFIAPLYKSDAATCSTHVALRKVTSTDKKDTLWVQARTGAGNAPKVYRKETEITSGLTWSKTDNRFTIDGKDYIYDLPANATQSGSGDARFVGRQLQANSSVALFPVKDVGKDAFSIDGGIQVTDQDAKVAVKLSTVTTHGRFDWDPSLACAENAPVDTGYRIIKFILGYTGTKWVINHAVDGGLVGQKQFKETVAATDFKVRQIQPITLVSPIAGADNSGDKDGNVLFRFKGLDLDSVGGYLVGLAEDPKFTGGRALYGGLFFVRNQGKGAEQKFTLSAKGQVLSGATAILREVIALQLPGWERANYKFPIVDLFNADAGVAGVYNWKAIAILDTSASQFLADGFSADRFYGESDFGAARGAFAVKGYPKADDFTKLDQQTAATAAKQAASESFLDRDQDGYPDFMELNYKTDPNDKSSFPNFLVDSDRDGIADFLEMLVDPTGVDRAATDQEKKAFFTALVGKGVKWVDTDGDGIPDDVEKLLGYDPNDPNSKPATHARATAPSGIFSGLIRLGDNLYPLKFKVRQVADTITVSYSAYLNDTLSDTVRGDLNETMGEFLFPIRLPDNGPDSGKSLLLRGAYDKTRAFLSGVANRVPSVAKNSVAFAPGPFVGQYAASGRGEDVTGYLGIVKSAPGNASTSASAATPSQTSLSSTPAVTLIYRKPPSGLGNAKFYLRATATKLLSLTIIDEFGDTAVVLDSTHAYLQDDGTYDVDARLTHTEASKQYNRRVDLSGRLGRGKDSLTDVWVLDGNLTESVDSCRRFDPTVTGKCLDKLYRDVPGQFSAKVKANDPSVKTLSSGITGDFSGWFQQDKFGTGLVDGSTPTSSATTGTGTTGAVTTVADPVPPPSFSNPYPGTAAKFKLFLSQAGIGEGEVFYVSMRGRVMRTSNDSLHVKDGAFPYCGSVQIIPTPIPLLDGSPQSEKDAFRADSILATSPKFSVLAIEDDALPGAPAKLTKARDALGFVRDNVFLIESRYLDPSTFVGGKCLDGGGLPPPFPLDAGLPPLPTGAGYFRGDLTPLAAAVATAGNQISVIAADGTVRNVQVNPATLRIDNDTRAAMAADADDPSLGYVFLGLDLKPSTPKMAGALPSALPLQ